MKSCSVCAGVLFSPYCQKKGYSFFRCRQCNFLFVDLDSFSPSEYYNSLVYFHSEEGCGYVDYEADKEPMRLIYLNLLDKIKSYGASGKLLDLGAGSGHFLSVAGERSYLAEGLDISVSAVEEGRRLGRKISQGDLLSFDCLKESFNVVTASDFLEHLPADKLNTYLQKIKSILSSDGILAVITVNTNSWWAKIFGTRWHTFLPPEHLSYFNNKNIKLILENNGFEVLEIKTLHKKFTLQYLFHSLYRWQRLSFWRYSTIFLKNHPYLGTLSFWIPIGDNMLVLARKRQ